MSWRTQTVVVAMLTIAAACTTDRTSTPSPSPPSISGRPGPSTSQAVTSSTPPPADGRDIGLGTNVCRPQRLGGVDFLGDGVRGSAWTSQFVDAQGRCPRVMDPGRSRWIVAVDVTGDGAADAFWSPIKQCRYSGCGPLGAADLDGDGDKEIVIGTYFSIVDHLYFSIRTTGGGGYAINPILVAPPGHPAAGVSPSRPLNTSAAGDAGYAAWMRCEDFPEAPVLVWVWVFAKVESGDPAEWHEVKLRLEGDGMFHVVGAEDFTLPNEMDPGLEVSDAPACGVHFNPWVPAAASS